MKLGRMLLAICKERKISLSRLAEMSGVPKATLHGWTTGRSALNLGQLKKVAAALEMSLHELAFGMPDPFEQKVDSEEVLRELFTGDVRVTLHRIERQKKK